MKVILSPSKTLTLNTPYSNQLPVFHRDAIRLRQHFKSMPLKDYIQFFSISKELAKDVKQLCSDMNTYKVIDTYSGIQFKTFHDLGHVDVTDLYIASGLYGILHSNDAIYPYRMDLKHPKLGSVTKFYKDKITSFLQQENDIYLCVSSEYAQLFDSSLDLIYVDIYLGDKKAPSVDAKKVRGAFAHYLLKYQGNHIEHFVYQDFRVIQISSHLITIKK